jgi:type VI protein secretion system component VasK
MIDFENAKLVCIAVATAVPMAASYLAQSLPSGIDKWIERGGTGLCVLILILVAKSDREERKERQKFHDERDMERQKKDEEREEASTAAREKLAVALEKLTDKIEKR